ncbi:hypothetical protein E2C01_102461 [Portunus trituberculatus]|uniref:Endonuclease/exonuclease/phosphatase domain-containing protein n=1 Tax=Portunus trituberculatus TaxID=210409 RepID=A0A5B7KIK8_PORTR|nr:hypothetical protein [Portunus trituberculatus]
MEVNEGIEFITVCLHTVGEIIYSVNTYIHAGALNIANFSEYVLEEQSVIMGDFNAWCGMKKCPTMTRREVKTCPARHTTWTL